MKLKEETSSNFFDIRNIDNAIVKLCYMMLSSIYRICIVCFMETLKWIKTTLKSIEGRTQNVGDIENIVSDCTSRGISLRRERIVQTMKYSSTFNDMPSTSKVYPGSLRERTNKANPFESKYQSYMKYERAGKGEFPKNLRFVTFPSDDRNSTTIKVLTATRSPHKCCLAIFFHNHTQVVSRLHDSLQTIDMTLRHNSMTLEGGYGKRYIISPTNDIPSK
jgi:hypothetical protein